ncbi:MAG: GTP-binding protein [Candidatus Latescibacteria bacterium]|jgi:small GTP-binding protein|nr:GTP-binding protein [Candidatus Latescibacterota bacterium]
MMQKKVCMLGAFAVGKTSLISRYVHSMFSDKYQTTVGVKIDKKVVSVGEHDMTLILWDVYGEDDFMKLRMSYLRGAAGYFLVADGTRKETLDVAEDLKARVTDSLGDVPFILLLNKADLQDNWQVDAAAIKRLQEQGWIVIQTSAKTGDEVEAAFECLVKEMMA